MLKGRHLLDLDLQDQMEWAFDADLSRVRITESPVCEKIGVAALAFGDSVLFAPGRYAPDNIEGRRLLAHEITHVLQQRAGIVPNQRLHFHINNELEDHADACADLVANGERVPTALRLRIEGPPTLAIQPALVIDSVNNAYITLVQNALDTLVNANNALAYNQQRYTIGGRYVTRVTEGAGINAAQGARPQSTTLIRRVIASAHWTRIQHSQGNDCSPDKWLKDKMWSGIKSLIPFVQADAGFMRKVQDTGSSSVANWSGNADQTANLRMNGTIGMEQVHSYILLAHELIHADRIGRGFLQTGISNSTYLVDQRQQIGPHGPVHLVNPQGAFQSGQLNNNGLNVQVGINNLSNANSVLTNLIAGQIWVGGTMERIEEIATVGLSDDNNSVNNDPNAITENMIRAEHAIHKRLKYGAFNQVVH